MQSRYRITRIQRGIFNGEHIATFHAHYLQDDGTWRDCGRFRAPVRAPRSTLYRYVVVHVLALCSCSEPGHVGPCVACFS